MPFKPVDTALRIIVGPAIDDTDFKTREEALAYNQAGMEVDVILEKHDGTIVTTAVTPTSGGVYDWVHTDQGYYSLELPASGGGTFNNTEEGIITVVAYCTGVLPFRSVSYDVIPPLVYASTVKGTDNLQVDTVQISGDAGAANNAELAFDGTGYGFTGCTMPTVTTLTGHTAQTGDSFARIGATGSALTSLALASICTEARLAELAAANLPSDIDDLLTRLTAARAGYLDNLNGHTAQTGDSFARIGATGSGLTTLAQAAVCTEGRLAELAAANIPADIDTLKTNVPNVISLANIRTQADDALIAINLDHLIKIAVDTNWATTVHLDSALGHLADVGGAATFDRTTDSNEAIRNRGDTAWTTGAGGTPPELLQNTTINALATQISFTLVTGSVDDNAYNGAIIVITDAVSGVQKAVGRISDYTGASKTVTLKEDPGIFVMAAGDTVDIIATDKLFPICTEARLVELDAANLPSAADNAYAAALGNFTILSSGVHGNAAIKALIDAMQGNVTDILGDTDEIQGDWANGGRLDLLLDRVLAATEIRQTSVNDAGATTTKFETNLAEADNDFWNRGAILFTSGNNSGQMRRIKDYVGASKEITVQTPLNAAPANADTFLIVAARAFLTVDIEDIADQVWDEELTGATHNIPTSAGRRLRDLGAYHITSGTAQGGTAYSITLAAADTAADHIYNRNLLVILAGTGAGQTRTIVDFANATKIAVVDRDWWVQPDNTSEYTIIPDDTPIVADHGVATAGTGNTITIRASASAISNTYQDLVIFIMAGTGAGQARLIDTYDGGTKVATIHGTWTTTPDATSVYAMISSGTCHVIDITPAALAQIKTQADDALTDVHLDDLIQLALTVNDGAPNAADFITSSAVAIDDWYNENMLLFTSGALAGLARFVDDYDGATKRIYLAKAFPQAPANTDAFVIVGVSGSAPTAPAVAGAVWDELEAGHTLAGSFGEEVTKQGKKLDRNLILDL